ncbi:MAG: hypothetical protein ACE5FU_12865, partial [Nitrospinota bacterium]
FLTGSDWEREGVHLSSLPTRDAVLPIVSVLHLAKMRKIPLSELFSTSFENRFSHSDIVDNTTPGMESYTADIGKEIIQTLSPGDKSITQLDFQRDSCTVHRENQQLEKVSRDTSLAFQEIRQRISSVFGPSEGFGEVGSINFIDGVRVTFTNNETLHLRPSGNAPEFRTYGLATTRERAEEIVEKRLEAIPRLLSKISGAGS